MPNPTSLAASPNKPSGPVPGDLLAAVARTHFGAAEAGPPRLTFDWAGVLAYLAACVDAHPRVTYGLGKKIPSINAVPGRDFTQVDCSGFVRMLVLKFAAPTVAFPDGSVVQADWVKGHGFAPSTIDAAKGSDGRVYIAFLRPEDTTEHIGHVVLIRDGMTIESHGHVGPDRRPWNGAGWQGHTHVFILEG